MGVRGARDGALGLTAMTGPHEAPHVRGHSPKMAAYSCAEQRYPASGPSAGAANQGGRRRCLAAALLALCMLPGCKAIGGLTGAAAGVAAGTFSSNPAVGVGVGIAVQAATDEVINRVLRDMQSGEQNNIASLAGSLPIGQTESWAVHHTIPFHNEEGTLQVVRDIDTPLAHCREIAFMVYDKAMAKQGRAQWFITPVCQEGDGAWRWAAAEPAVERWGNLQ